MKADAVSFNGGVLSVSWGAQFSAFVLPVNCFCSVSLFKHSSITFKLEKKYLVCVRNFSRLRIKVLDKITFVCTVLLKLLSAGTRREGEGKTSSKRGRKRTSDLDFT